MAKKKEKKKFTAQMEFTCFCFIAPTTHRPEPLATSFSAWLRLCGGPIDTNSESNMNKFRECGSNK